jgi:hydrogenase maturation protease
LLNSHPPTAPTLLLALGNPLRADDGVGAAVVAHLTAQLEQCPVPPCVTLMDGGTPGLETVLLLQGYQRVVIIDAADMRLPPGQWRRFTPEEVRLQSRDMHLRGTLHYAGLAEALSLGASLGLLPPEIVIFGVQPENTGWAQGLSPSVAAAVPAVAAAALQAASPSASPCLPR